jgi:hypothetical protein
MKALNFLSKIFDRYLKITAKHKYLAETKIL